LVFGLENAVDLFSSVIVLWRFYCPGNDGDLTPQRLEELQGREKRASLAISFVLVFLGIGVIAVGADDLIQGQQENDNQLELVLSLSFISIVIFGTLCVIKFHYAHALDSASLYKDGICSTIGCILAGALLVNTLIIHHYPDVWYLDPAVALFCGIASFWLGWQAIVVARWRQGLPIFTRQWWNVSTGDGMDEMGVRDLQPADFGEEPPRSELELTDTDTNTSDNPNKDATTPDDDQQTSLSEMV
jgi:hypothetical protein